MPFAMPKIASTAVLALVTTALAVPLTAQPAAAVTTTEKAFFTADSDIDGSYGLYAAPTSATGTRTAVVAEATTVDVHDLSISTDGSRAIFVLDTYASDGVTPLREKVEVADASGRIVRVLEDIPASSSVFDISPELSPDGTSALWTRVTTTAVHPLSLRKVGVGSGTPAVLASDLGFGLFVSPTTVLATSDTGMPYSLPYAGGTRLLVPTYPNNPYDLAVSPDGQSIAYTLDTDTGSSVNVAALSFDQNNGGVIFGTGTVLASTDANFAPSFSRDGTTVYFINDAGSGGDLWSVPANASSPAALVGTTTAGDEDDVAIGSVDDTPPAAAGTAVPAALGATTATVKWTLPADADLSGVVLTRTLGATVQKTVYVPAPVTSYADTGLVVNNAYVYSITAVDRSGHSASAATRSVTPMSPGAVVTDPTTNTATRAPFAVRFAAAAPSNAKFTVDYNVAGTTTWYRWVTALTGITRTFGAPATSGVAATTATPGASYNFRVTAVDGAGNSTAAITAGKGVVPFDQTKATLSGGATLASTSSFMGSIYQLKTTASYAKVTLLGNRLQVVGIKCPGCGLFAIYDGSTKVANVDTYASTTKVRQVLFAKTYTAIGTHTFTIRPLATAGRPAVELDGFAMRR